MENISYKAVVSGTASKLLTKKTGATYVLHPCTITEAGPLKGFVVTGSRTLLNANQDEKEHVLQEQEVTLHLSMVINPDGTKKPFFEIGTGIATADDAAIIAALGMQAV